MSGPQFHVFLPQMRMTFDALVARAAAAEASGFDGLALMDHLAPPRAEQHDMWEAVTSASWLLANTRTLTLSHLVLCDSFRHPAVLARQAVTLDHASGGRFELGIGWGSVPQELATFGVGPTDSKTRIERLSETLDILEALWSGERIDFDGRHFVLSQAQQRPVPIDRIPLIIGGAGPRTLELVRDHADWWNLPVYALGKLDELRPAVGGARVSVQQVVAIVTDGSSRDVLKADAARRFGASGKGDALALGSSEELSEHFCTLYDRGVERFYLWFSDFAVPTTLEVFGQEVIPAVRAASST